MATPPKSPPRRAVVKNNAAPAKPAAKAGAVPAAPFVIESGGLSAFVDKNDAAFPSSTAKPEAKPATPVAKPAAATSPARAEPVAKAVEAPAPAAPAPIVKAADPAPKVPVPEIPVPEIKASPSQPAVAVDNLAATSTPAAWQTPNAVEGHHIMNEAIETSKKFAEDAKARLQTLVTGFNEKAKVAVEKSSKTAEELGDITKGNLEAFVESSKIAAKGFETLGQGAAEYGRQSFEKTSATLKSFASVKSPTEFFQLQSDLLTSAFDALASESARTSEAVLKLAGEIAQPISSRYAVVSDKLKTLAA